MMEQVNCPQFPRCDRIAEEEAARTTYSGFSVPDALWNVFREVLIMREIDKLEAQAPKLANVCAACPRKRTPPAASGDI